MQDGPFGIVRGAYAVAPYSLPAGGVFSYGRLVRIEKRDGEDLLHGYFFSSLDRRKEAKEDQGVRDAGHLWPGTSMYPKRDGENFAGGRSRPSLDRRKEGKRRSRPLPRPGKLAGYGMIPKRDGEGIAGVTDLLILAGIGEAEYVWIPICFKGLKAFSCR